MQGAGRIRKEAPSRSLECLCRFGHFVLWKSADDKMSLRLWGILRDSGWQNLSEPIIQHIKTLSPPEANRKARTWQTDKIGDLSHLQTRGIVMVTGVQNHVTFTHSHTYYDYDMDLWGLKFCRAVVTSICRTTTVIMDMEQDDTTWNNTK